jgi:hypothetical protein
MIPLAARIPLSVSPYHDSLTLFIYRDTSPGQAFQRSLLPMETLILLQYGSSDLHVELPSRKPVFKEVKFGILASGKDPVVEACAYDEPEFNPTSRL